MVSIVNIPKDAYVGSARDYWGLEEIFIGKSIIEVTNETMTLNDGRVLNIEANEGCGGCESGRYELESLATFENIITNVDVIESGRKNRISLFVYSNGIGKSVIDCVGDEGFGYYGSGFTIKVVWTEAEYKADEEEVKARRAARMMDSLGYDKHSLPDLSGTKSTWPSIEVKK